MADLSTTGRRGSRDLLRAPFLLLILWLPVSVRAAEPAAPRLDDRITRFEWTTPLPFILGMQIAGMATGENLGTFGYDVEDAQLRFTWTGGLRFDEAEPPEGACTTTGTNQVDCPIGTLTPGTSVSFPIYFTPIAPGEATLTVDILSSSFDPDLSNNQTTISVNVGLFGAPTRTRTNHPQSGDDGDPVNMFTGELFFSEGPDLYLGGPLPLFFDRYYASFLARDGRAASALGPNWMHTFDWQLSHEGDLLEVTAPTGRVVFFKRMEEVWVQQTHPDLPYQLHETDAGFRFADPRLGLVYHFDDEGRLTRIEDGRGKAHLLSYANGRLAEVTDGLGRTLTLAYDGQGRLTSVSDGSRAVQMAYEDGLLAAFTDALGGRTDYAYASGDHTGLLTARTLPRGNTPFTQTYDAEGRVATQADAFGHTYTFTYAAGTTTLTGPAGHTTVYTHDDAGRLTAVQDHNGRAATFDYTAEGHRRTVTDRAGGTFSFAYAADGGVPTTIHRPDGTTTAFTYQPRSADGVTRYDVTGITYPDGTAEALTYDAAGNVTAWTDRAGNIWRATYDAHGQPLTSTAPDGAVTAYTYDEAGRLTAVQQPDGSTTIYAHDASGRIARITRPDGTARTFTYDAGDRLRSVTDEGGGTTHLAYDANGNLTGITDPLGHTTTYAYDDMDRLVGITDPLGHAAAITYDALGRRASITDPNGHTLQTHYNAEGRLASVTGPEGGSWTYTYDEEGVLASVTDPLGVTVSYTSDAMGRLTGRTGAGAYASQLGFDPMGRVASIQDALGGTTTLEYDAGGAPTRITLPGGLTASYQRDAMGRLVGITDPAGNTWTYGRDVMGRLHQVTDPLGRTTTWTYDSRGRGAAVQFPEGLGTLQFTHDARGNVTEKSFSDGTALTYTFDAAGRVTEGTGMTFTYDAAGRLTGSNGLGITRDAAGRMTEVLLAPGKAVAYQYDRRGLVTQVTDWRGGTTTLAYDAAGRLLTIERPNGITTSYTYDDQDQLLHIQEGSLAELTAVRDAGGQLLEVTRTAPLRADPAAHADTLATTLSFDAASQVEQYTYDALGRRTADEARTYTWNLASMLTGYTEDGTTVHFSYDALGHRLTRETDGTTRAYVWNYALALPAVSVVREDEQDLRYYVHLPGGQLLYSIEAADGARRFYHYDEAGNTLLLTDDAGAVLGSYAYTPYGRLLASTGDLDNPFTFHGQYGGMQEGTGGLYYMRARYYDAVSRQFISRDPAPPQHPRGMNPYQFAYGNPLRYADPTGLDILTPFGPQPGYDPLGLNETTCATCPEEADVALHARRATARSKVPVVTPAPGPAIAETASCCGAVEAVNVKPDVPGLLLGLGFAGLEEGFKYQGRQIIQEGLKSGNFAGATTAGTRAFTAKALGTVVGGAWGGYNEYQQAQKEGQGTASTVVRTTTAFAADAAIGFASTPVALVDAATGGNFSQCVKQAVRVPTAALGDENAQRAYAGAASRGDYGCVVQTLHNASDDFFENEGRTWVDRGVGGTLKALYQAFCY